MTTPSSGTDGDRSPMQEYTSFYDVLGITPGEATENTVEAAYRDLVKQYHPDVSHDPDQDLLTLVRTARDVLGDPDERARYDSLGHNKYARLRLNGDYTIATESASAPTGSPSVWSTSGHGRPSQGPRGKASPPAGAGPGVTSRDRADPSSESTVDAGEYSHDRAFDFLSEDKPEQPHNAPDHVADVFLQAWINRVVVIGLAVMGFGAAVYFGGLDLGVSGVGIPSASFLLTAIVTAAVFTVSGLRRQRELYRGADDPPPLSLTELRVGGGLVAAAAVSTLLGTSPPVATWDYARRLLFGGSLGPSPWLTGGSHVATGVASLGSVAIALGALIGGSLLVAGIAHRAWYARFIDGRHVLPTMWEIAAVLPLLAIYWAVVFGEAEVAVIGPVMGSFLGPTISQDGGVSFLGLGILGLAILLGVVVVQDLRLRSVRSDRD